jgi:hypothetical protein
MNILTVGKDSDKIKMQDMNEMAYSDLTLAMDTSTKQGLVASNLVMSHKTTEYRDGHAGISWMRLLLKYQPHTGYQLAKLHKQFYASMLKPGQDLDVCLDHLVGVYSCPSGTLGSRCLMQTFVVCGE